MTHDKPKALHRYGLTKEVILSRVAFLLSRDPLTKSVPFRNYDWFMRELTKALPDDFKVSSVTCVGSPSVPSYAALYIFGTDDMLYATTFSTETLDASHFSVDLNPVGAGPLDDRGISADGPPWVIDPETTAVLLPRIVYDHYREGEAIMIAQILAEKEEEQDDQA